MKKFSILLFLLCALEGNTQGIINFRISKPYCLLSFMQTASAAQGHSFTYKQYIDSLLGTDKGFRELVKNYAGIRLSYAYRRDEIPAGRRSFRTTYDLIVNASVKAADLSDFRERISGIIPNGSLQKLYTLLVAAESYYDRIIWNRYRSDLEKQLKRLKEFSVRADTLFRKLRVFYNADWSPDLPFTVGIYVIPGKKGHTTASAHGNSLCVGVLSDEENLDSRMSVVMHEMCHVLYDEQPAQVQQKLDAVFNTTPTVFNDPAYSYFDEAIATAAANGWTNLQLSGAVDTGSWYNDRYIDAYGHALYPQTAAYINGGREMDSVFIREAIRVFAARFPKAAYDYDALINKLVIYSDTKTDVERRNLTNTIIQFFTLGQYKLSSPILHEVSTGMMKKEKNTQLIILSQQQDSTLQQLSILFPQLKTFLQKPPAVPNYVVNFYDGDRCIIILKLAHMDNLEKAIRQIKQKKYFDPENPVLLLD